MDDLSKLYRLYYYTSKEELRRWDCPGHIFEDIYQEVFSILIERQKQNAPELKNPLAYIIQMCKFFWFRERKESQALEFFDEQDMAHNPQSEQNKEKKILLLKHLKNLPVSCQEVLTLYAQGYSEEKISGILKLGTAKTVKNKKYYCKEKLRNMIINDPLFDEIYG